MKNGPEIVDFRPVLRCVAALANRRLQPLGHLTLRPFDFAQGRPEQRRGATRSARSWQAAECKYTACKHLPDRVPLALPTTVFRPPPLPDFGEKLESLAMTLGT
jgi:hypothetical protein